MIDPEGHERLTKELHARIQEDRSLLDNLRAEVRQSLGDSRPIKPRSATAISFVATDGGNNRVEFDPFLAQVVRVVDSSRNEYQVEVITPSTDRQQLGRKQLGREGEPPSPLGRMMAFLGVEDLWRLSPMIQPPGKDPQPSWVQVYRELTEWAVLFSLVREKEFGSDTIIVCDGLLRSKVFHGDLFHRLHQGIKSAIADHKQKRRNVYVVGVAKHSKVLQRYRLAMLLEGILRTDYPAYVAVPRALEEQVYKWGEYARGDDVATGDGELNKFVAGKLFLVKFGSRQRDPIWPVDVLQSQESEAPAVLGYLLADALGGFPVPFYPQCLQKAHENAALADFDNQILQTEILRAIRNVLTVDGHLLDEMLLMDRDPSQRRYNSSGDK